MDQKEQQKQIVNMVDLDSWTTSALAMRANPNQTNVLQRLFGATRSTPLGGTDFLRVEEMLPDDHYHRPSLYSCPCDPALPLLVDAVEQMKMTDIKPPHINRKFEIIDCDENIRRNSLAAIGRLPNQREMQDDGVKTNIQIMFHQDRLEGEIRAAIHNTFEQTLFWGRAHIMGKGIPKKNQTIDFGRDDELFTVLSGEGWKNKNAAIREVYRHGQRRLYDCANYCPTTDIILSPEAEVLHNASTELSECMPCGTLNPRITNRYSFDATPTDPTLPKGIRPLGYEDGFSSARYWVLDERKLLPEIDPETGKWTGKYTMQNVMPAGAIMFINRNDIAPMRLQGRIPGLKNIGSPDRYARSWFSLDEECYNYRVKTSPFEFIQRQCVHMMWVDPETCPPPCWVNPVVLACDPEGGKKLAAAEKDALPNDEAKLNKAIESADLATKQIEALVARLDQKDAEAASLKEQVEQLKKPANNKGNK